MVNKSKKNKVKEKAVSVALTVGELDHHGELELKLSIDDVEASLWISQEIWESIGEYAGWSK